MDNSTFMKVAEYLERLPRNSRNISYPDSDIVDQQEGVSSGSCHSSISGERRKIAERKISAISNNPLKFVSPNLNSSSHSHPLAFKAREQAMLCERQRQNLRMLRDSAFCDYDDDDEEDSWQASLELWRKKRTPTASTIVGRENTGAESVLEPTAISVNSPGFDTLKEPYRINVEEMLNFGQLGLIPEELETLIPGPRLPPSHHHQRYADIRRDDDNDDNGIDSRSPRTTSALRPTTYEHYKRSREEEWWNNSGGVERKLHRSEKPSEEPGCLIRIYIDPREITQSEKAAMMLSGHCDINSASIRLEKVPATKEKEWHEVPSKCLTQFQTLDTKSKILIEERSISAILPPTSVEAQYTDAEDFSKALLTADVSETLSVELGREESVRLNASCIVPTVNKASASLRLQLGCEPCKAQACNSYSVFSSQLRQACTLPYRAQFSRDAPGRLERSTPRWNLPLSIKGVDCGESRSTGMPQQLVITQLKVAYPSNIQQLAAGGVTSLGFEVGGGLEHGVVVNSVSLGSYAAAAGLKVGDTLLSINGVSVERRYLYSIKKMLSEGVGEGKVLTLSVGRQRVEVISGSDTAVKTSEDYRRKYGSKLPAASPPTHTESRVSDKDTSPLTLTRLQQLNKLSPTTHTYSNSSGIGSAISPAESTCTHYEDRHVQKRNSNLCEAESPTIAISREERDFHVESVSLLERDSSRTTIAVTNADYRVISMDAKRAPGNLDDFIPEVERETGTPAGYDWRSNTWRDMHKVSSRPLSCEIVSPTATLPAKLIRNYDLHNGSPCSPYGRWQFDRIRSCTSRETNGKAVPRDGYFSDRNSIRRRGSEEKQQEPSIPPHARVGSDECKPLAGENYRYIQRLNSPFAMTSSKELDGLDGAGISRVSYKFYNRHMRELPSFGRKPEEPSPLTVTPVGHPNTHEWRRFIAEQRLPSSNGLEKAKCCGDRVPQTIRISKSPTQKAAPDAVLHNLALTLTPKAPQRPASRNIGSPSFKLHGNAIIGEFVLARGNTLLDQPTTTRCAESPPIVTISGRHICNHCGTELGNGAAMIIESLKLFYHLACFRCVICGVSMGNGERGTDVRIRGVHLHCQRCFSDGGRGTRESMSASRA